MARTTASFDLGLYPATAVLAAAHRFSGTHSMTVTPAGESTQVILEPRQGDAPDVTADLHDAVVDEALRELVRSRTQALHEVLVRAAFAPVTPS